MKELSNEELMEVQGGGIGFGAGLLIIAGIAFAVGVIDGIVRPLPCR